jgi:hypothetical protein
MKLLCALSLTLALGAAFAGAQNWMQGRPTLVLEGKAAQLTVDLGGGSIADFHLNDQPLNPLSWDSWSFSADPGAPPPPDARSMGHFLCLDRWGPASEAETANGMGWHGEATRVTWSVLDKPKEEHGRIRAEMSAQLPMAGLSVRRRIALAENQALFVVTEEVANNNKLGRLYNMVQHPTIGPPFLDEHTLVDANGRKGFMQSSPLPNPEEPAVFWPQALDRDGRAVNLRHLSDSHDPGVVSYVIDEEYGWTTASSPSTGLLIGYIWKTAEYPWFDAWRHTANGKPFARGLEFGTSGLHQPFPILVEKGPIFGRPIYEYLDAGETASRSYACFLFKIPADYQGVASARYADGKLTLRERDGKPERDLVMEVGQLFP